MKMDVNGFELEEYFMRQIGFGCKKHNMPEHDVISASFSIYWGNDGVHIFSVNNHSTIEFWKTFHNHSSVDHRVIKVEQHSMALCLKVSEET